MTLPTYLPRRSTLAGSDKREEHPPVPIVVVSSEVPTAPARIQATRAGLEAIQRVISEILAGSAETARISAVEGAGSYYDLLVEMVAKVPNASYLNPNYQ